ncbi:sugar ABC transporter permease [Microbacterium sp. Y-01]|uniref:carbohydrate ABC transporter permease n=1 Tax=Microbacterium sp. Y-01 TaxID=2048898 RepID=UPI000F5D7017|nr:carbohydrate ABC transporter permease [Microbacterium sp. Y-01]AZH79321.1 sugar ABC transporter permease [Microbacterium sp. Y-01]
MRISRSEAWIGRGVLLIAMIVTLVPLLSMFTSAITPSGTVGQGLGWPEEPRFDNFVTAFASSDMLMLLSSTAQIVVVVVPVTLLAASLAGYGLAVLAPRGSGIVLIVFVLGLAIPVESLIVPLYYQFKAMGLLNTRWAVCIAMIATLLPFAVFWMRTHFVSVPRELTEAALVDGASSTRLFSSIHLPLAANSLASLALLLSLWTMNGFLIPVALVDDPTQRTLAGALGAFQGQYLTDVPLLNAAALLISVPALVLFLVFQRKIIAGLIQGAVK